MNIVTRLLYQGYYTIMGYQIGDIMFEVVEATNSVCGLIHDVEQDRILLIEQSRIAVATTENPDGMITELIAGRLDRESNALDLLVAECLEEAGITVDPEDVQMLNSSVPVAVSAGMTNEHTWLGYVPVRMEQIADGEIFGLQHEGERITRKWLTRAEFRDFIPRELRVFALKEWFFNNIKEAKP
jgi:8-oxo-dGTP pyrophosphatase MutT (NUDIX family)